MRRRLLLVAAPMVSLGGMYSYLQGVLPEMRRQGGEVGLLWSSRVPGASFDSPAWQRELQERGSLLTRQRALADEVGRAVAEFRPETIVSLLPQADIGCALARSRIDVPWTVMAHGRPYPAAGEDRLVRRLLWQMSLAPAYRRADRVIAVSQALAEDLRRDLRCGEVLVIRNGVTVPADVSPSHEDRAEPILGFLGRLSTEKAPDVFIETARLLGAPAHLYGSGPLESRIAGAAASVPGVSLRGWADRDAALAAIDILVLTSHREALGLVLLEAGARGRCVVARAVGGVPEIFASDPELAARCLVPKHSGPVDFATALRPLLADAALRADLATRLRRLVKREFSLPRQVQRLFEALTPNFDQMPHPASGLRESSG